MTAIIIAVCAWILAAVAVFTARRALATARQASSETPTREERIAHFRGRILAAREMERTLGDESEFPERLMLAGARAAAVEARERLRVLGIEA